MGVSLHPFAVFHLNGIINSYGQIFFTRSKPYGLMLLLLSLLDLRLGAGGLTAVLLSNLLAHLLGFSKEKINEGLYGFNAVFIGISMCFKFHINLPFLLLFLFAVILGFMLSIWLETLFNKQRLPILTLPFVLTLFVVDLSYQAFTRVMPILPFERVTTLLAAQMKLPWYDWVHSLDRLQLPQMLYYYLRTMASVFFSDSILVGALLVLVLLLHSRIKSTVAFLGFLFAFVTSKWLGVDLRILTQNLAGVNYIFWGMALGSFFLVPNSYSYLLVIGLTPVLFLIYTGTEQLITGIGLSSYTLSFSLLSILLLYILRQRSNNHFFIFPYIQHYHPEKTVYKYVNHMHRFGQELLFKLQLPFLDRWIVSQGYDGGITHLGPWSKALDFEITDEHGSPFSGNGSRREEYYCYNKPVLAPADGYVSLVSNITDENEIGNVDREKNWGNSIIINHLNGLYTQMSHLKKESFRVRTGDYVKKGTVVAACGNSGRSPVPHLHFQVQLTPELGAATHPYPFGYFFTREGEHTVLHTGEIPREGSNLFMLPPMALALDALSAKPGRLLRVSRGEESWEWLIATDAYNKSYIRCTKSRSRAYFENDGTMFYFTDFEGRKSSPLYPFYQSCFKLLLSAGRGIEVSDRMPLTYEHPTGTRWLQDLFAPFVLFTNIRYRSLLAETDNIHYPGVIIYHTETISSLLRIWHQQRKTTVTITPRRILIQTQNQPLCIEWD
ncbi:MAG: urea transporter [bacterium]|nr:urea transporter [bacterium]MDD3625248.1 urea transporter [Proteiniphilum sp.]MDD3968452.1 urea transporter [Proteiniphilum sp.]